MPTRHSLLLFVLAILALARPASAGPNISTPRETIETFLRTADQGDFRAAAQCLDLRDVPRASRAEQGVVLAKELYYVLDRHTSFDLATLPDDPQPPNVGDQIVAAEIPLHAESVDVALSRVKLEDGTTAWLLSRATVAAIPVLYRAYGPPPFYFSIPQTLRQYEWLDLAAWQWLGLALALLLSFAAAHLLTLLAQRTALIFTRRTKTPWDDALVRGLRRPVRLLAAIALYELLEPLLALPGHASQITERLSRIAMIGGVAWMLACCLAVGTGWAGEHLAEDIASEQKSRGLRTQLLLLRRIGAILIGIVAAAVVLLQFETVRNVGVSLLASAGVAGIVLGFALQKSLTGVIAGIQVSLTQPFRLGDMVVVEGEQGTVEQINLTYVVIRVWDQRRLIVPMQRILELPFQNWTKISPELLGTVKVVCDYATPIDALRGEIQRLCASCADWNRERCEVAVVDATDQRLQVRVVVSANDGEALWRLRCELREKLVSYLASHEMGRAVSRARAGERLGPS